jgi:hypothetical protein
VSIGFVNATRQNIEPFILRLGYRINGDTQLSFAQKSEIYYLKNLGEY